MALQILLNVIIAIVWMLLTNDSSPQKFIVGYIIGAILIGALRRFWQNGYYLNKVWAVIKLILLFNKELVKSGVDVIKHILRPKLQIRPGIFAYTTKLEGDWEITLLSCLITLTPGTLTMEVSEDGKTLYIHAIDIGEVNLVRGQIRDTFEKAIMEVTRK
ncbi:Na(+)/H(+) antiporter subunit E [compost metagenome]